MFLFSVLVLAESSSHTPVKLRKFSHQFINNRALRKFAISLTFLVISLGMDQLEYVDIYSYYKLS
jgi:hypothetical protein